LGRGEEERDHDLLFWLLRRWAEKEEGQVGWVGERERRGFGFLYFFKLCKLHSNKHETMHSNYDAQALIASKIIKMIFKYFKDQIYLII
jgi:hypothetical protein